MASWGKVKNNWAPTTFACTRPMPRTEDVMTCVWESYTYWFVNSLIIDQVSTVMEILHAGIVNCKIWSLDARAWGSRRLNSIWSWLERDVCLLYPPYSDLIISLGEWALATTSLAKECHRKVLQYRERFKWWTRIVWWLATTVKMEQKLMQKNNTHCHLSSISPFAHERDSHDTTAGRTPGLLPRCA